MCIAGLSVAAGKVCLFESGYNRCQDLCLGTDERNHIFCGSISCYKSLIKSKRHKYFQVCQPDFTNYGNAIALSASRVVSSIKWNGRPQYPLTNDFTLKLDQAITQMP
ncbi:hypothetical protein DSM106972_030930 [Dulcicalothrix desertica PCC 7102]|uniref:Uncharacterized protein n=1 Tax=Dulcicalothrix desertica PCC 7102 TaxID=232991 RepID=A0A433VIH7_9CYAN|nr:hypothetical protein [Dulcicalothrix desertica]RUT05887.1 hypothetical protein DSM106972_030930 [Dulcicalothrix desertica PCC 7102]TWH54415.1 hypothetical protein CAL7102_02446 [Dulcicalothrix desertica PCC 7102]